MLQLFCHALHKFIDTREKREMDQRPLQATAQLHTCCPSLSPVWRDGAEMQGLGWGEREEMALDVKFSLDVERNGLQHIHQIVRHSTEKHIQRLDTLDVQSSLDGKSKVLTAALWVLRSPAWNAQRLEITAVGRKHQEKQLLAWSRTSLSFQVK